MLYPQSNQQKLLRSLNPVFMVGFFLVLMLVKTTAYWLSPWFLGHWDILLPFMVYFGQRRPVFEGLLLWFILAHLYTLQSAAPIGVFVIYYLLFFGLARLLSETFYATTSLSVLGLMAVLSVLSRVVLPFIANSFESGWPLMSWRNLHIGFLLCNTFAGWICYLVISALDKITYKADRLNIELGEVSL
ncbi:MAG: hypothetical protein EBZ49_02565 [Proteobacteria bacterium]|nr:hypothetical protein [Pseudomonadota bacterium]NDC23003.1 hypothetical protein [Pseudomonadota bacterium]